LSFDWSLEVVPIPPSFLKNGGKKPLLWTKEQGRFGKLCCGAGKLFRFHVQPFCAWKAMAAQKVTRHNFEAFFAKRL